MILNQTTRLFRVSLPAILAVAVLPLSSRGQAIKATPGSTMQANQSEQAQIQALTNRVASLEQKLAALDKRLTASSLNPSQPSIADSPSAPSSQGGLSPADPGLANTDRQVNQPQQQQGGETQSVSHPAQLPVKRADGKVTRFTAPFEVVDSHGGVLMAVDDYGGSDGGLKVYAPDGSRIQIGGGDQSHQSALRVYSAAESGQIRAFIGMSRGSPQISIEKADGSTLGEIIEANGHAELDLFNPAGKVAAMIGSNPTNSEGHARFNDAGGTASVLIGGAGDHGDVLMYGDHKAVPVWEFMLTGFH